MSLDSFLYNLHFDTDKARPPDLEVDWQDAPLSYKLYRGLPVVSLSPEIPLTLEGEEAAATPDLRTIGNFLWYVYGLAQLSQTVFASDFPEQSMGPMQTYRRFAPSGGALYPNELYVYLKLESIPIGVYHYDVAHHRLVLLREGDFDSYLAQALGNRCDVSACFCTAFVSTMFWKNFFKYNNFAYRLQGLDAGVLIGQLLEVAKRFGFTSAVYFQFLDRAVNHLLGLTEQEESVYAVIPLSGEPVNTWFAMGNDGDGMLSASELCRQLPVVQHVHYVRSRHVLQFPMLIKMNEASFLESTRLLRPIGEQRNSNYAGEMLALPQVKRLRHDLAQVCRTRYSPDMDFRLGAIEKEQLATFLQEVMASYSYRNDLDGTTEQEDARVSLYGCLYQVEGIQDGAYLYDSSSHALRPVRRGDYRLTLQSGMSMHNVNLYQVPLSFHVVGKRDHWKKELGYRGYRIQQMEVGMLVQRIVLTASAMGMGGHPLLGFDVSLCDRLYRLVPQGRTSLIQIPVGPHRPRSRLQGGLHG